MEYTLKLELPEDVYALLISLSGQKGLMPESLASHWIISQIRNQPADPLEKFIGKFRFSKSDWADNHDCHIGETLNKDMKAG